MEETKLILCEKCNKPKMPPLDKFVTSRIVEQFEKEGQSMFCNCGRPTKYKEEYILKVDEYLKSRQDEEVQVVKQANVEKGYKMFDNKLKVKLPTIEGFARFINVNKTTLYEWESSYPEFSNALEKIRTEQQERLINAGLSGDYNSTIAKLILSSNHGMREKSETDLTTGGKAFVTLTKYADTTSTPL